jgi:hypothetical protein
MCSQFTLVSVDTGQTVVDAGTNIDEHAWLLLMMVACCTFALEATLGVVTWAMIAITSVGPKQALIHISAGYLDNITRQDVWVLEVAIWAIALVRAGNVVTLDGATSATMSTQFALIIINANTSVTIVTSVTCASVWADSVAAAGVFVTFVTLGALVNVNTINIEGILTLVTSRTSAVIAAGQLGAVGVGGTGILQVTLEDIDTAETVSLPAIITCASVITVSISASGIHITLVIFLGALIDVFAWATITAVSGNAITLVATLSVWARGVFVALILSETLIDIVAMAWCGGWSLNAIVLPAGLASTEEAADWILTGGMLVAWGRGSTLVNIGADFAGTSEASVTSARVWALAVSACGIIVTWVGLLSTLINIVACDPIATVTRITVTVERAVIVSTRGIGVAVMGLVSAFVIIGAVETVTGETSVAAAWEWTNAVFARTINRTRAFSALINISTGDSITSVTDMTFTFIGAWFVGTLGIGAAVIGVIGSTFVVVETFDAIVSSSSVTVVTCACEWSVRIVTTSMDRTVVQRYIVALVNIFTSETVTGVTILALASVWSLFVGALGIVMAVISVLWALINIVTSETITAVTIVTGTCVWSDCISASSIGVTLIGSISAFINIGTIAGDAGARVTLVTGACEWTFSIAARGIIVAIVFWVHVSQALIHITAWPPVASPPVVAVALIGADFIITGSILVAWVV